MYSNAYIERWAREWDRLRYALPALTFSGFLVCPRHFIRKANTRLADWRDNPRWSHMTAHSVILDRTPCTDDDPAPTSTVDVAIRIHDITN